MQLTKIEVPVVGILNGIAAAAGCQLLASTDIIIATNISKFTLPAIKNGLFPTTPAVPLSRAINWDKKLMEVLMLG
jgi:enoyl-CoA hydratase/carnithine racemase